MTERGFDAVSVDDIVAAAGVSRRTFFNYFADKESVVFDPDPDDPALWGELLGARPGGEPLWVSLREVVVGYTGACAERMILQRRVRLASPELAGCSREVADRFWDAVREWAAPRAGVDGFELELVVGAARMILHASCPYWDASAGIGGLHSLVRTGFDTFDWTRHESRTSVGS
ncbi:TetR family transcriptional regulator [Pseudosporangium ferrugineum]|uniref:TetR family transcriptional regulator n=2 Tax=Pseudosporangium ferrugineum TaxID=439699 RepID=A0A2T0RMR3_9ACTN|nr:TetR family transcriptional regulator [Pseudosporangium ferrugineum]